MEKQIWYLLLCLFNWKQSKKYWKRLVPFGQFDLSLPIIISRQGQPNLMFEGMSYKTLSFTAKLQQGKLIVKKIYLDSPAMKVTGQGTLDIISQKIDFNIIVAPLRTVDRIFGIVPLVGGILQTILTVPVKVEGSIKDPKVTLMDPSVVGSELSELMQDTFQNPIKLIYPGLK